MPHTDLPFQPRSRRGSFRVLLPAGIGMALALAGDLTLYAVLPAYAGPLGISLATIGLLLSANRLVRFVSNPLVGLLANRFGRRRLMLAGLTAGLLSTLLYGTQNAWIMGIGRLLWGISWSVMYIGFYCIIIDITSEQERGWGTGMLQTFYFTGMAVTPVLGGLFVDRFGFDGGLLACAALQGLGLIGTFLFLPETFTPGERGAGRLALEQIVRKVYSRARLVTLRSLVDHRETVTANYLYMATLFVGDGIIMSTISLYLQQRFGDTLTLGQATLPITAVGGGLLAIRAIISGGTAPITGHWSDMSGSRWSMAGWGAVLIIAGCALLALDGSLALLVLGIVLAAFGSGMLLAVLPAIVSSIPGQQGSLGMGLLTTSGDIGSAIAPLVGLAMLRMISLSTLYLISAGMLVAGAIASMAMMQPKKA